MGPPFLPCFRRPTGAVGGAKMGNGALGDANRNQPIAEPGLHNITYNPLQLATSQPVRSTTNLTYL